MEDRREAFPLVFVENVTDGTMWPSEANHHTLWLDAFIWPPWPGADVLLSGVEGFLLDCHLAQAFLFVFSIYFVGA